MKRIDFGRLELEDKVDITDPCYDKDVWCRITTKCKPGIYYGYVIMDKTDWGKRVSAIGIAQDGSTSDDMECIGDVGVDAGLAGFFRDKPDYNDDEWDELCKETSNGDYFCFRDGIFSYSGYGDGVYPVYASRERDHFKIVFI